MTNSKNRFQEVAWESSTAVPLSGEHPPPAGALSMAVYPHDQTVITFPKLSKLDVTGALIGSKVLTTQMWTSSRLLVLVRLLPTIYIYYNLQTNVLPKPP